ncbi:DEAD/DEAH box helicase family protein [Kitasatospora sp. NPDC059811]|uniref:DEAD/DEAH box helicase family protein n=1 Tax=unclassified Kitasatospora TaxID=2633591 RepID=UPI00364EFC9D
MPIELRDHQIEAVDAIIRALDIPPGGAVPADGLRAQVHAACGTGKTYICAAAARRMVPRGRVLVLVPTLALLGQTIKAWREVGHTGPAVAVCSMEDDVELWSMDVRCTTNPIRLAMWHGSGPVTMFATYSSLGVLAEAFEGAYGKSLDPLDLAVVDEAHRTSGSLGKAWADIHHQDVIPAARRLYATATPRIWQERPAPSWELREGERLERLPQEMAASMDDEAIFGPVAWKLPLSEAVKRGLLARYQIIVVELTDPVVTPERLMSPEKRQEEIRGQQPWRRRWSGRGPRWDGTGTARGLDFEREEPPGQAHRGATGRTRGPGSRLALTIGGPRGRREAPRAVWARPYPPRPRRRACWAGDVAPDPGAGLSSPGARSTRRGRVGRPRRSGRGDRHGVVVRPPAVLGVVTGGVRRVRAYREGERVRPRAGRPRPVPRTRRVGGCAARRRGDPGRWRSSGEGGVFVWVTVSSGRCGRCGVVRG